ncbi:MAG: GDSL-type esterase/lipase family protein [Gemmatimonadota bacterium]
MSARRLRPSSVMLFVALTLAALPTWAGAQNTAIIPAPFQEARHDAFVQEARAGGIECLLMGDSITDWWRRTAAELYAELFASLKCANFGIAGDRTQGVLWRMETGELEGYSPRLMMLMIGTNNLSGRQSTPNTPAEIAMGIAAIVTKFRTTFPEAKVLLLGVFPRGAEPTNQYREPIRQINELIANLDDGENVRFMDIGGAFLEPDGSISEAVMPDGLHPSARGYEIWAEAVMPTFREMMGR